MKKNRWLLVVFILAGLVVGGLLGEIAQSVDFLKWLSYGQSFGLDKPLVLNLNIVSLTFAMVFKINIASIVGLAISLLIYKKV